MTPLSIDAFEALDFDPAAFDHEAHVAVAFQYLDACEEAEGSRRFVTALKRLTSAVGQPGKYHDTISRFYLAAIAERKRRAPRLDWPAFRAAFPELLDGSLLRSAYSPGRLAASEARHRFLAPDWPGVPKSA